MVDVRPKRAWNFGETGLTGAQLDDMNEFENVQRIEEAWPADSDGNKLNLGNSIAETYKRMPPGVITMTSGLDDPALDPVVSEAQRRAMYAAKEGHSNLGIPKSVGEEMISKSHGVRGLPERKK